MRSALAVSNNPRKHLRNIAVSNNPHGSKYDFDPTYFLDHATTAATQTLSETVVQKAFVDTFTKFAVSTIASELSHLAKEAALAWMKESLNASSGLKTI